MEIDRSGCEVLTRQECLTLLAGESMGRLGVHAGALPVILPVAYVLDEEGIVLRTHEAAQLYGAARESVVAFEVDRPPGDTGGGWSVHVTGLAQELIEPEELERARALPLRRWGRGEADRYMRISTHFLSGTRLTAAAA